MSETRHLVDPELLPGLEVIPTINFTFETLPGIREQMAQFTVSHAAKEIPGVSTSVERVPSRQGHEVRVLVHRPDDLPMNAPAVLYAHGGGFLLGSADAMRTSNQLMARDIGCLVVSVDYRLPPETPHPGPVEDCYAALLWMSQRSDELGIDSGRIAVAGESAGGGLAAATALLARDRGEVQLVHQHLTYPMLDDRTGPGTANPFTGEFVWTAKDNRLGWTALVGQAAGSEDVSPYAAPARADELAGLPSTYLAVGALDLFAEENLEYARRLMRAGVRTECHLFPGAYHGFELASDARVTQEARRLSETALRRALFE